MLYGTSTSLSDHDIPARARELQVLLEQAYEKSMDPKLSVTEQRALDRSITAMECELTQLLDNQAQAETRGGYYTDEGIKAATGQVYASPALVLGNKTVEPKKNPWPWIIIALVAAGTTYYTIRG